MPRTRSIAWAQLKLGIIGVAAVLLATALILAVGGQGGFFWQRYPIKALFKDVLGMKSGAIVRVADLLAGRHHEPDRPAVVFARTSARVGEAIAILQEYGISQVPVSEDADGDAIIGIVGSIHEKSLLDKAFRDPSIVERTVGEVMDAPLPLVDASASLDEAFALLSGGAPALVAVRGEQPAGVLTKLDLLEYLAHLGDRRG